MARSEASPNPRTHLLEVAGRLLEASGPEALQARAVTAEVGTSTQAIYTLFGGMPGLFEALVVDGLAGLTRQVKAVPESDDPVADFFAQGRAYVEWALAHSQRYRLMFGLTGGRLRLHSGLEMTMAGTFAPFPEGQEAAQVMVDAMDRIQAAGRIRPVDSVFAAGQFLSATHGYVLLEIGGAFGDSGEGVQVIWALGVNVMVGLGDDRAAAERSLASIARRPG
jgi:AcrR family transcriptional regulator